ncbi:unnamed protein product [Urochloa humidicola]
MANSGGWSGQGERQSGSGERRRGLGISGSGGGATAASAGQAARSGWRPPLQLRQRPTAAAEAGSRTSKFSGLCLAYCCIEVELRSSGGAAPAASLRASSKVHYAIRLQFPKHNMLSHCRVLRI